MKNGELLLEKSQYFDHPKKRHFIYPLPRVAKFSPIVERIQLEKEYIRGCPSALTKYTGNLQYLIKPFRQAFYTAVGIDFEVYESYPDWDSDH